MDAATNTHDGKRMLPSCLKRISFSRTGYTANAITDCGFVPAEAGILPADDPRTDLLWIFCAAGRLVLGVFHFSA